MEIRVINNKVELLGYICVDRDSRVLRDRHGEFVEQITRGTFGRAIEAAKDIKLLFNHDKSRELGSILKGNVELYEDNIGLRVECTVDDPEVVAKARAKKLTGLSFGFVPTKEHSEPFRNITRRFIDSMKLLEVSILDQTPAYFGSMIDFRGKENIEYRGDYDYMKVEEVREEKRFLEYIKTRNVRALETLSENGGVIPTHVADKIAKKVVSMCPILEKATVFHIKGALSVPKFRRVNANYIESDLQAEQLFETGVTLGSYVVRTWIKVSNSLINNASETELIEFITTEIAAGISEFLNKEFLTGTTKIKGILHKVTSVGTEAVSVASLRKLQFAIKTPYQANSTWVMHPSTFEAIASTTDTAGSLVYPVYTDRTGQFTLFGKVVYLSEHMPQNKILYGDLKGYYINVSELLETQVLREEGLIQHQTMIGGIMGVDGDLVDLESMKILQVAGE